MPVIRKTTAGISSSFLLLAAMSSNAWAEYGLNFPEPAATTAREIYDIHMLTMQIATFLLILVFAFVLYSIYFHRKSRGFEADQNFHKTWFGQWSWVIVPAMVLGVDLTIASNAQRVLESVWEVPEEEEVAAAAAAEPEVIGRKEDEAEEGESNG